jgi:hypothetical protein
MDASRLSKIDASELSQIVSTRSIFIIKYPFFDTLLSNRNSYNRNRERGGEKEIEELESVPLLELL